MSLPATDNFAVDDFGTNWTIQVGGFTVSGGAAVGTAGGDNFTYWSADTFGNDQYSQAKITSGNYPGVTVRMTGTAGSTNGYLFVGNTGGGSSGLYKVTGGSYTVLGAGFSDTTNGTVIKATMSGTTLEAFYGASSQGTRTDATYASGSAGIWLYSGTPHLDDWEGSNVGGGTTTYRRLALLGAGV